jgi:ABC-type glycerol-3-phosphate transport system permease component
MAILPKVGRRSPPVAAFILFVYAALVLLGTTMVVPFLITVASSATNDFDYDRFSPVPRYVWNREHRFIKGLVYYFNKFGGWEDQLRAYFHDVPAEWTTWRGIGKDDQAIRRVARRYLEASAAERARWAVIAADYAEFAEAYPVDDTLSAVEDFRANGYLAERYEELWIRANPDAAARVSGAGRRAGALELLNQAWGMPLESFFAVGFAAGEMQHPVWQQSYFPPYGPRFADYMAVRRAYKAHRFTPGVRRTWLSYLHDNNYAYEREGEVFPVGESSPEALRALWLEFKKSYAPAAPAVPLALRAVWLKFLDSEEVHRALGLAPEARFDAALYNRLAGTDYRSLAQTPFPLAADAGEGIRRLWRLFVEDRWPLRLTQVRVTAELEEKYRDALRKRYRTLAYANELLGSRCADWGEFRLAPAAPPGAEARSLRSAWASFVKSLPMERRVLDSSEISYQRFLLAKYGSLEAVNRACGWNLKRIEEAQPPFDVAYAVTFLNHERAFVIEPVVENYVAVYRFLVENANALPLTLALILLTVAAALTVNPLAAYALSRFNMRGQDKILLFMLATMAFPAMVSAIPAYLLMRDLGLLNTLVALVIPGAANGMAIFILKGFFDSLPPELFEAATIDGANEWQIFRIVAMPLIAPILAISALTAFLQAYNGWEWALIICQDKRMWTVAVWMYQVSEWWKDTPWVTTAGFVVASIPTLLVFVFCQRIILRGIIIPSMR